MSADRLTALETSFLWFERPGRPLHVGAVATFEGGPLLNRQGHLRLGEVRKHLTERVGEMPRLRQRIVAAPLGLDRPRWVDDPDFDITNHVSEVRVPAPGDEGAFRGVAEQIHAQLFDQEHPLWHLCFVTGLADGRVGLIERVHHALVDGVGGVDLAAVFLDIDRAGRPPNPPPPVQPTHPRRGSFVAEAVSAGLHGSAQVVRGATAAVPHPSATVRSAAALARGFATVAENGVMAPQASLNTSPGSRRELAWVRSRLVDLKAASHAAGGTVNDVVLAAVTSGLRSFLIERGVPLAHDLAVKALVPVSERGVEEMPTLGNRVSGVLVPLPVGVGDPDQRLATIVATMRRLKASGEADSVDAFLHAADLLPAPVARAMVVGANHQRFINLVVTNVPGPPIPLYLLGAEMLEAFPVVPLAANLTVGVAILSYNGALNIGLTADADACPDVDVLAQGIERGLAEVCEICAR